MLFETLASDIDGIAALIESESARYTIRPRSVDYVAAHLPCFGVVRCDDKPIACMSYRLFHDGDGTWAELRSLVVDEEYRGEGYANFLMMELAGELGRLGVKKMFVFTNVPEFFEKYGFCKVDPNYNIKSEWIEDCIGCAHSVPQRNDCKEIFMVKEVV